MSCSGTLVCFDGLAHSNQGQENFVEDIRTQISTSQLTSVGLAPMSD